MFAYCCNNPISRSDESGEFWNFVVGAIVGAVVGAVTTAVEIVKDEGWGALLEGDNIAKMSVSAAVGAVGGLVAASGAGLLAATAVGAATSIVETTSHKLIDGEKITMGDVVTSGITGAIGGFVGGKGATFGNKYMGRQVNRLLKHIPTDGIKKATTFFYKMTANYSKQFVGSTILGIAKSEIGGTFGNLLFSE